MGWLWRREQTGRSILRSPEGRLRIPIAVGLGAIVGALSRYYLSLGINQGLGINFPIATLFINLSGAFVMGFFTSIAVARNIISPDVRLIVAVGFLGSYTTFSTYMLDIEKLVAAGNWQFAFLYWVSSTLLGLLSLELGCFLARRVLSVFRT
jgi:CrcB protein